MENTKIEKEEDCYPINLQTKLHFLPFCMSRLSRETTSSLISMMPGDSLSNDTVRGFDWPFPIWIIFLLRIKNYFMETVRRGAQSLRFEPVWVLRFKTNFAIANETVAKQQKVNFVVKNWSKKQITMSRKEALSQFINQIHGRAVVVKLNSGVDYRGL